MRGDRRRRESIAGYFAGHTHRNRVRHFAAARDIPIVEIACVKDYPGAWAEYRVYEGGYTQLIRRIATPGGDRVDREDAATCSPASIATTRLGTLADRCFTQSI